jgi:hypothetical protein
MSDNITLNQLTLFAEDSPASPLAQQGTEKARQMTVTSGLNLYALLKRSDPLGFLERMFQASYHCISTRCYLTWSVAITPAGRLIFQLVPLMPPIGENGSTLLPTKRAQHVQSISLNRVRTGEHNSNLEEYIGIMENLQEESGTWSLAPEWCEWEMGFPIGWTDLER